MDKAKAVEERIKAIVRNQNHMLLMCGQSCVEWFRQATIISPNNFNFLNVK